MTYAYIRVSTDMQTVENQRFEIKNYCQKNDLPIHRWVEETISGTKDYERRELGRLLGRVKSGDTIICTEISRLGRQLYMIMDILFSCEKKGCRVVTIKDGFRLENDISSKVLAFAFSLSAEIERQLISQRTKEALRRKKAEGVILGRPKGAANAHYKLDDRSKEICAMIENGVAKTEIARRLGVSRNTLYGWLDKRKMS